MAISEFDELADARASAKKRRQISSGPREVMYAVVRLTVDCSPFPGDSYPLEVVRVQRADPAIDWLERRTEC